MQIFDVCWSYNHYNRLMAVSSKRSNIRTPYVSKDDDSKQELPSRNSLAEGKDLDDVTTFTAKGFTQSRFSNGNLVEFKICK